MNDWPVMTGWLTAERDGANSVGPGAGWDPLWAREMDDALRLGDLAARMVRVATELTAAVATADTDAIRRVVRSLTPERLSEDVEMLLVVQAAMIAGAGATAEKLLAWVIWDEWGQPLPLPDADAELSAGPMLRPVPPVEHVTPMVPAAERQGEHRNAAA